MCIVIFFGGGLGGAATVISMNFCLFLFVRKDSNSDPFFVEKVKVSANHFSALLLYVQYFCSILSLVCNLCAVFMLEVTYSCNSVQCLHHIYHYCQLYLIYMYWQYSQASSLANLFQGNTLFINLY